MTTTRQVNLSTGSAHIFRVPSSALRMTAFAFLVCALACTAPGSSAFADSMDQTPQGTMMQPPSSSTTSNAMDQKSSAHAQDMQQHVEERIKTLHDKLKITSDQESKWNDVAQAMRDNEQSISQLIEERHQNASTMTAVDDLQSYQSITQAHADGMKKLISAFQPLYESMPADQQKNADMVFGKFEGHHHSGKSSKMHQ